MAAVRVLVTIVVSLCLWSTGASGIGRRRKRLLNAIPMVNDRDPPAYSAIRYTVWVGNGNLHFNQRLEQQWYQHQLDADPENMMCTGVLLTPDVVQVPCGCVATFLGIGTLKSVFRATPLSLWENKFEIFFSEIELEKMNWFILAKHYIVYDKCAYMRVQTNRGLREPIERAQYYMIHDYGLIVLNKKISEVPEAEISYAPTPTFEDIIRHYHEALRNEYVCLFFGYGHTAIKTTYYEETAKVLHYGWRSLMNYQDCYIVSIEDTVNKTDLPIIFNYQTDATWVCAKPHRPKTNGDEVGANDNDQGGPVTCNEEYFGFIGRGFIVETTHSLGAWGVRPKFILNLVNPIVYTLWENSVNYRERFISNLKKKLKDASLHPDPFDVHIDWHPDWRPTEHFFALSRSPAISGSIIYSTFFILMFKNLP